MLIRRLLLALLGLVFATELTGVRPAWALQDAVSLETASKVLRMNREAMDLFEDLEFDLARQTLNEALAAAESAKLGEHFSAATTHGNLGIVLSVGLKDRAAAVKHFRAALAIKPDYRLPADFKAAEAREALAAAKGASDPNVDAAPASAESTPAAANPDEASTPPNARSKGILALRCPTSGEVLAGDDITMRCVTAPDLQPAAVVLYYKQTGGADFVAVPMSPQAVASPGARNATWTASIPGADVRGNWLPYYFEARNPAGDPLAMSGRFDSPNILTIKGGLDADISASTAPGDNDDENPLAEKAAIAAQPDGHARAQRFFVGLGVGSGIGYAAGPGLEAWRDYGQSFAPGVAGYGLGHALPELGYYLNDTLALTVTGRIQYIPRPANDNGVTAGGAFSALARALFFSGTGDARFYGSLAAGGGEGFRMVMKDIKLVDASGNAAVDKNGNALAPVQDTVRGGPVVAGAGGGFSYDLGGRFSFMVEANLLAGFPDFSLGLDVNTGLRALF